ncbi:MAG TPA: hypothetical protein VJC00_01955 [Candidatus Nanoarchaeia archaeon]|nr:hypothetical protein [Candidatus Nanoarchaeia archaeon]
MKEDKHAKAISLIRMRGPVIPSQINKELSVDVLTGSAILSELVDNGQLKLSSVKVGSSPVYYIPGQEARLQQFSNHLNAKDKETYDMLRQSRVLRDKALEPLRRVSLRQMKDFAKPLNVKVGNEDIIFWKWYLLSNDEAASLIKTMIPDLAPKEPKTKQEAPVQKPAESRAEERIIEKKQEISKEKIQEKKPEVKTEVRKEKQEKLETETKKEKPMQKEVQEEADAPKDKFFRKVKKYFDDNGIKIVDYKIIRKESDIDFTVNIQSSVGSLAYFCKAKNKKKFNDGDVSSVFIEGQRKKLPVLFLVTGELTKKAKEVLDSEFKNMYVKRI